MLNKNKKPALHNMPKEHAEALYKTASFLLAAMALNETNPQSVSVTFQFGQTQNDIYALTLQRIQPVAKASAIENVIATAEKEKTDDPT